MLNPWLAVPLSDYEAHMNAREVQQLDVLSDLFAEGMALCRPSSVAIFGIAGGNGLDHIDKRITSRIVGLDLNQYISKPSASDIRVWVDWSFTESICPNSLSS